jgi:hypothetical protein
MDHSNLKSHKACRCAHGKCLNHNPEWENIGQKLIFQKPLFFGLYQWYLASWCCRRPMTRYQVVQNQCCKKCGRQQARIIEANLALCVCCGYHCDLTPSEI